MTWMVLEDVRVALGFWPASVEGQECPSSFLLQGIEGVVGEVELFDDVKKNEQRGGGVKKGIVPVAIGKLLFERGRDG